MIVIKLRLMKSLIKNNMENGWQCVKRRHIIRRKMKDVCAFSIRLFGEYGKNVHMIIVACGVQQP